jgi:polysaccharide export outer membrane protein
MLSNQICTIRVCGLLLVSVLLLMPARACAAPYESAKPGESTAGPIEDYKIGAGDILTVTVMDAPEFGGKFLVSDSGSIEVPGVSTQIHAEGLSPAELALSVHQALIDAKQLRDPRVTVFVDEYHGRTVTVVGAVNKPAVYALQRKTTVLDALSMAGGALPNSGNTVTIVRGPASAEATNTAVGSVQILQMSNLVDGSGSSPNVEVKNGDVINVSAAQLVYVVGAVVKPGGYTMADPSSGVSVIQAIALAEGLKSVAKRQGLIVRQSTSDHGRVEIPVDFSQMVDGRITDVVLAPNDILYVPTSGAKKTLKALGDIAIASVVGIATYGVGYRVGNVK